MTKVAILERLDETEALLRDVRAAIEQLPDPPLSPAEEWWQPYEQEQEEWRRTCERMLAELGGDTDLTPTELRALTSERVREPNLLSQTIIDMREE